MANLPRGRSTPKASLVAQCRFELCSECSETIAYSDAAIRFNKSSFEDPWTLTCRALRSSNIVPMSKQSEPRSVGFSRSNVLVPLGGMSPRPSLVAVRPQS